MPYGSQKDRVKLTQLLHRCVRQSLTGSEVALRSEIILLQCVTESGPGSSCFQDFETLPHHSRSGPVSRDGRQLVAHQSSMSHVSRNYLDFCMSRFKSVSYTHLTLPTIYSV